MASGIAAPSNPLWRDLGVVITATSFRKRRHHPFVDGNKRVAVTVTAAFLRVNGYRLEFDDMEAFAFLVDLYETGALRFKELEVWLRQHAVPCELPI